MVVVVDRIDRFDCSVRIKEKVRLIAAILPIIVTTIHRVHTRLETGMIGNYCILYFTFKC